MMLLVTNKDELNTVMRAITGGETIALAPGNYGKLAIVPRSGYDVVHDRPVTITSLDLTDIATFTALDMQNAAGFIFDRIEFNYTWKEGDSTNMGRFTVDKCQNVTIRNSVFVGDTAKGGDPVGIGYPTGRGLTVSGSGFFTLEACTIFCFWKGVAIFGCDNTLISRCNFFDMRSDGLNLSAPNKLTVAQNRFRNFNRAPGSGDHADMIQMASTSATRPACDIVIRGNHLDCGDGSTTQSIFMRNDAVDTGAAGREMFYRNIEIFQNTINNRHSHGITVGETDTLMIRDNVLTADGPVDSNADIPQINVALASVNVKLLNNTLPIPPVTAPGWKVT